MFRQTQLAVAATLVAIMALTVPSAVIANECEMFPATGQSLCGRFLQYWLAHGGLAQLGYPLSDVFLEADPATGRAHATQYFERARFEYHPENPPPYDILLGLLGREQFLARYPGGRPPGGDGRLCFDETYRCIREPFYSYWLAHGGLAQLGYPLSDVFLEADPATGRAHATQYFERARFEYHPENPPPYDILLGLLGREQFLARYPGGQPLPIVPAPPSLERSAPPTLVRAVIPQAPNRTDCLVYYPVQQVKGNYDDLRRIRTDTA